MSKMKLNPIVLFWDYLCKWTYFRKNCKTVPRSRFGCASVQMLGNFPPWFLSSLKNGNFHIETAQRFVEPSSGFVESCGWNDERCFRHGIFKMKQKNALIFSTSVNTSVKWWVSSAKGFCTFAACSLRGLSCTCLEHTMFLSAPWWKVMCCKIELGFYLIVHLLSSFFSCRNWILLCNLEFDFFFFRRIWTVFMNRLIKLTPLKMLLLVTLLDRWN